MSSSILSAPNLQIWDNAAFDDRSFGSVPGPHLPLQPISLNLDAEDPTKENRSPRSKEKPGSDIDAEIADIETEINRLSKKLEALKIKKAQILASSKTPTPGPSKRGGRIVPAKFLNVETPPLPSGSKTMIREPSRRGLSLGPMDIHQNATPFRAPKPGFQKLEGIKEEKLRGKEKNLSVARRRGMSLGPSEILRQTREKAVSFKVPKGEARSLSTSPKPRKPMNLRVSDLRKGVATVGPKKPVKMDEGSISGIIKPKTLIVEKKRPLKNARVRIVASRYNEEGSKRRKWSLPEAEQGEEKTVVKSKNRAFSLGGANLREKSPSSSIIKIVEGLPKIRTAKCGIESPRDSGCAKRVAELVGRSSCFAQEGFSCQTLNFEDGEY